MIGLPQDGLLPAVLTRNCFLTRTARPQHFFQRRSQLIGSGDIPEAFPEKPLAGQFAAVESFV
jgi:hypothetical protein